MVDRRIIYVLAKLAIILTIAVVLILAADLTVRTATVFLERLVLALKVLVVVSLMDMFCRKWVAERGLADLEG